MWKIIVGFIVFAALAMFVVIKGGSNLDMSGEKHGGDAVHAPASAPAAASPAPAASQAAPAPAATGSAAAPAASSASAAKP